MKVAIIGGGAIGLLSACLLGRNGIHPAVYCRTEQQADLLREKGIIYINGKEEQVLSINAFSINDFKYEEDIIIVCVKQTSLLLLKDTLLDEKTKGKTFLFLQNGMSHVSLMNEMADDGRKVWAGVAEHGVLKEGGHKLRHTGEGRIRMAPVSENEHSVLTNLFGTESEVEITKNYLHMLSEKLIINAAINPVTAIFKVQNGKLLENPHFRSVMEKLFEEAIVSLEMADQRDSLLKDLYRICRNTKDNRSSMLRDIESGCKTEIESISGYIIKRGEQKRMKTPYTEMVFEAVKGMEWEG